MIRNCCKKGLLLLLGSLCTGSSIHAVAGEPLSPEQAELTLLALPLPSIVHELVGLPEFPRGRKAFLVLLTREAHQRRLPPELADAVTQIESGYDPTARGGAGEIGLMQVMPGTAAMLGFVGTDAELAVPETNIRLGVQYLADAWRLAGGNVCRALMKYRAGHGEEVMSARSAEYCRKARTYLSALGSPLAGEVLNLADTGQSPPQAAIQKSRALSPAERSRRFWQAHEVRIRALTQKVHAKWRGARSSGT
jgi:hypothetical protein